jgi:hypothetical protein
VRASLDRDALPEVVDDDGSSPMVKTVDLGSLVRASSSRLWGHRMAPQPVSRRAHG